MYPPLEQIIEEDLAILRQYDEIGSKLGDFIASGSYGFVLEYRDGTAGKKVIKILDPKYVACNFQTAQPQTHTTLLSQRVSNSDLEWSYAQKIGYTKSPHLMPLMHGPGKLDIQGRTLSFLVMPQLDTIEALEISPAKERQIVSILSDCCSGLQVLHRHPEIVSRRKNGMEALVHSDIKPSNIFYRAEDPPCFLLGDYSIAQKLTDLEKERISIPSSTNPYCAPDALGTASDIYALGWVLFYWMNNKKHPTENDVAQRAAGTLEPPASWGDNPELWNVFLAMTNPVAALRIQRAEKAKAELLAALQRREERLSNQNALAHYGDGKTVGRLETAGLVIIISAAYHLLKRVFGPDPIPTDSEGRLHGNIRKDIPYLGGSFRGKWEHGSPKEGTYISPTGTKRTGQWAVRQDYVEPFLQAGTQTFTGMLLLENGKETSYQGHIVFQWPWGTHLTCDLEAGRPVNCVMTFANGEQRPGPYVYLDNQKPFCGMLYSEKGDLVTGCAGFFIGPQAYVECELVNNIPGTGRIFLPNRIIDHTAPSYPIVLDLLIHMMNAGGRFEGEWDDDGFPRQGTYVYRKGKTVSGDFSFAASKRYPQFLYTGMVGDDGLPWGIGTAQLPDGEKRTGEFWAGALRR